ncbi:hypothetical protein LEP1GSC041_4526 [Leptospira noguchii str. 2006001870]|nr:hypothetical protein LEP1GSC041_4526 [Leptospira noguchii str. 2006001870]
MGTLTFLITEGLSENVMNSRMRRNFVGTLTILITEGLSENVMNSRMRRNFVGTLTILITERLSENVMNSRMRRNFVGTHTFRKFFFIFLRRACVKYSFLDKRFFTQGISSGKNRS